MDHCAHMVAYWFDRLHLPGSTPRWRAYKERCQHPPCREPDYCGWAAYCGATDFSDAPAHLPQVRQPND